MLIAGRFLKEHRREQKSIHKFIIQNVNIERTTVMATTTKAMSTLNMKTSIIPTTKWILSYWWIVTSFLANTAKTQGRSASLHYSTRRLPSIGFVELRSSLFPTSLSLRSKSWQNRISSPSYAFFSTERNSSSNDVESSQTNINNNDSSSSGDERKDNYATVYHAPVMWSECIDALLKKSHNDVKTKKRNKYKNFSQNNNGTKQQVEGNKNILEPENKNRIFVDGTLGGGGHSKALLEQLQEGDIVIGCDVDPEALSTATRRLEAYASSTDGLPLFVPVQSNFRYLAEVLPTVKHPVTSEPLIPNFDGGGGVDGILLDLGVSSHQIDTEDRGFAFRYLDGPLDMRMNRGIDDSTSSSGGFTAADICNEFSLTDIVHILKVYGDEPRARKIAQSIIDSRPLETTGDLYEAVAAVTPEFHKQSRRQGRTATMARVFQSFRIVVNEEDKALEQALMDMAPSLVRKGGRLVVLSYHSMEDRAVKRVMRDGTIHINKRSSRNVEKDVYGNIIDNEGMRCWKPLGKKQKATLEEMELNTRARSATLRVAERL